MALIDKLRFHNILIQGGLPKAPAVDFADALQETFDEQIGALASKADIELILERMDARFAQSDARVERFEAQVDARFEQFEAQVDARFERVDARFAQMDDQFARVDERFVQMEAHFEARMAQMEKHFEAQMDARFAQSERDAAKRETRQTRLFLIGIGITLTAITLATSLIIALT